MSNFLDIFLFRISWIFQTKIPLSVVGCSRENVAFGKKFHIYRALLMLERETAFICLDFILLVNWRYKMHLTERGDWTDTRWATSSKVASWRWLWTSVQGINYRLGGDQMHERKGNWNAQWHHISTDLDWAAPDLHGCDCAAKDLNESRLSGTRSPSI